MEQNKELTPDLEAIEKVLKNQTQLATRSMFHLATPSHSNKSRGVGITRKNKAETKKAVKLAKSQRAKNHKIANKKRKPTGSKKRK